MLRDFQQWLGPANVRALILALIFTGLVSAVLGFVADGDWVITVQSLLFIVFLASATIIIGRKLGPYGQRRLFFSILPALGLAILAVIAPSAWLPFLLGGAFGWVLAAQFFIREPTIMEYKTAIKHMRNQDYQAAINTISELIRAEPKVLEHLDFRARLFQLDGQTQAAIQDYEKMIALDENDPRGYSGLAAIYVQMGNFEKARYYSLLAFERSQTSPALLHDLALIEDRLGNYQSVIDYIDRAIAHGLRESRLLLLGYLWQARAYAALGQTEKAENTLKKVAQQKRGLKEWQNILEDSQAETVRHIYAEDIHLAERVIVFHQISIEKIFGAAQ